MSTPKELLAKINKSWSVKSKSKELCGSMQQMPEEIFTGSLSIDAYKEHLRVRQILITKEVTEESVETVALQIMKFNEEDDELEHNIGYDRMNSPITLKIASPGGSASACMSIVSQIVQSCTPVIGVAVGDCSSAAAIILLSCHARFASRYSRIMVHSMQDGCMSELQGMVDHVEESLKIQQMIDDLIVTKTKITQKRLDEVTEKKLNWFMNAFEAQELGVVDEVLEIGIPMVPFKERKKSASKAKKSGTN